MTNELPWVTDKSIAELDPVTLDERILLRFAGDYGRFKIIYDNGSLYLVSETAGKLEMLPMNERTFMLKEVETFRIRMIEENGAVIAAAVMTSDGNEHRFHRIE